MFQFCFFYLLFTDRTYGRAYTTMLRPSVVCNVMSCVQKQKLLLTAYRKSYIRKRLVLKWMTLTFV